MSTAKTPLLQARGLAVDIGERTVCADLDLALHAGERIAVLGRNGAGKSTLLATLAGLREAASGAVLLGGKRYADWNGREAACRRGWLAQTQQDAFATTVLETALTGRHPHLGRWQWESAADAALARQALAAVGLAGLEQRAVHTLSGGERQRLAIATLLTQDAPLYLLDEPLTHLDLNHAIAVLEIFAAAAREQQVGTLMVLHEPGLAARYCERVLLLYDDGSHELGACAELLTAERLSRLYGHPLRVIDDGGQPWFVPA